MDIFKKFSFKKHWWVLALTLGIGLLFVPAVRNKLLAGIAYVIPAGWMQYLPGKAAAAIQEAAEPRGIRNRNPGNIRKGTDTWTGEVGTDKDGFIKFSAMSYGMRATLKLLVNYISSGTNTISKITERWAPAADGNNPVAYADFIAQYVADWGISKDTEIEPTYETLIIAIGMAVSLKENGSKGKFSVHNWSNAWEMI